MKYAIRQTRMSKLANKIHELHAITPMQPWQTQRIKEIRNICEAKEKQLFDKANALCQEIREEHMQFEVDFIIASAKFREDHPGEEMVLEPKNFFERMFDKAKGVFVPSELVKPLTPQVNGEKNN